MIGQTAAQRLGITDPYLVATLDRISAMDLPSQIHSSVVNVFTEVSVDWEPGVTDEQIQQQLDCALATSHELFAKLAEEFPGVLPEASDD